ncbi:MAG: hypothetical protein QOF85_962 [Solirubrobacterales bacterium]|jgi:hypothetical protein|nr:hypothetical protein [Solirubrobacterales bacterium]
MSANLPNFTAPDNYGEIVGFLRCQDTVRVRINVSNQSVFWRRGTGLVGGSVGNWEPEEELPPGRYSLNDHCDVLQVRAAVPTGQLPPKAQQAQVSLATRTAAELNAGA